ncbi:hypothetical protein [Butyrivibrio proteoclasticus]|uniref:hypothetical protein n=1 Tax=Butyrivibrio proteoclasticus TaxID=43305 RepID=UPI00047C8AAF|nr:hypothetical protein [Butyrivibrio proteoclasticus]
MFGVVSCLFVGVFVVLFIFVVYDLCVFVLAICWVSRVVFLLEGLVAFYFSFDPLWSAQFFAVILDSSSVEVFVLFVFFFFVFGDANFLMLLFSYCFDVVGLVFLRSGPGEGSFFFSTVGGIWPFSRVFFGAFFSGFLIFVMVCFIF